MLYGRDRREVKAKLREALDRARDGGPVRDGKATVAAFAAEWRATTLAASGRKPATKALYSTLSRAHIESGALGAVTLDKLAPRDVEGFILELRACGLADSTVRTTYTVLRAVLDGAVRDRLLASNPAALVKRPGIERREAQHLDRAQLAQLLAAVGGSRFRTPLALIAATGLRRGECLALRWADVDLDDGVLHVVATLARIDGQLLVSAPKTAKSRRVLRLSPGVVELLRAHRKVQLGERLAAGSQWQDHGLVFATEFGRPVEPRNLYRALTVAASRAGVDGVGVHTLRHSVATVMLDDGHGLKTVSEMLGHSSVAITGDIYQHVSDAAAQAAADSMASAIGL